jgi:hypothetical protein
MARLRLLALALAACTSTCFAQDPTPTGMVVDANGTVMGPWSADGVLVRFDGLVARIPLQSSGRRGPDGSFVRDPTLLTPGRTDTFVVYTSSDCSGQGYVKANLAPGMASYAFFWKTPNGPLLHLAAPASGQSLRVSSSHSAGDRTYSCRSTTYREDRLVPVTGVIELDRVFPRPYRLQ